MARPEIYKIFQATSKQVKGFFSQGNFRTFSLLPMIFFFTVIAKWVAVVEIPENMNKCATKKMSFFNLSGNSCPSEGFKNIFVIEVTGLTFWRIWEQILCVKSLRFLQCPVKASAKRSSGENVPCYLQFFNIFNERFWWPGGHCGLFLKLWFNEYFSNTFIAQLAHDVVATLGFGCILVATSDNVVTTLLQRRVFDVGFPTWY